MAVLFLFPVWLVSFAFSAVCLDFSVCLLFSLVLEGLSRGLSLPSFFLFLSLYACLYFLSLLAAMARRGFGF